MNLIPEANQNKAFGWPGTAPRWTHGAKDGVGTAYAASSRVWFTFWNGIITEVYYPTVDRPQIRDLQYLITDGETFFHEEKRNLEAKLEHLSDHGLGYRCTNSDTAGRYAIVKQIIADPHLACVLQHTKLTGDESFISKPRLRWGAQIQGLITNRYSPDQFAGLRDQHQPNAIKEVIEWA